MEGRNVGTIRGKSPKQDLTSTKDLTIELPEGRESPYQRLDQLKYEKKEHERYNGKRSKQDLTNAKD